MSFLIAGMDGWDTSTQRVMISYVNLLSPCVTVDLE